MLIVFIDIDNIIIELFIDKPRYRDTDEHIYISTNIQ